MKTAVAVATSIAALVCSTGASSAQGEMGTGIPGFGMYGDATGAGTTIWLVSDIALPQPAGCAMLTLTPATMGASNYRIALAMLLTAKVTNRRVRFYAHAVRDTGCGVDYLEVQ